MNDIETLVVGPREAARMLGVSERTLFERTKEGTIPHVRIGALVKYRVETIKRWLAEQEAVSPGLREQFARPRSVERN